MIIEILGLLFSMFLGTIGHFLYNLTNKNKIIGFFFSTDESLFQHIKLGVTPILMWTIVELFTIKGGTLLFAKFVSIIIFCFVLTFLYFLYKFFIKKNILVLDILIFYISLVIAYLVSMLILNSCLDSLFLNIFGFIGIIFVIISYIIFN